MARFSRRLVADEESLASCLYNLGCQLVEVVHGLHALDLGE